MPPEAVDLNLTGAWSGLYSYPHGGSPVSFAATLTEISGWLSGAIEEVATAGPARGQTIRATVQGRRTGSAITFLKSYDDLPPGYDTVHYAGEVNHDATEIDGRWTIPGSWSGKFLMIRPKGVETELAIDISERVR
jgi:hypothetical protein